MLPPLLQNFLSTAAVKTDQSKRRERSSMYPWGIQLLCFVLCRNAVRKTARHLAQPRSIALLI